MNEWQGFLLIVLLSILCIAVYTGIIFLIDMFWGKAKGTEVWTKDEVGD